MGISPYQLVTFNLPLSREIGFLLGSYCMCSLHQLWQWCRSITEASLRTALGEGEKEEIKPQGFNPQSSDFQEPFPPVFWPNELLLSFFVTVPAIKFPVMPTFGSKPENKAEGGNQKEIYC